MQCFYDDDVAVGVCKVCARGTCRAHARVTEYGVVCCDACEAEAKVLFELQEKSKKALARTSSAYARSAILLLLLGLAMVAFGVMTYSEDPTMAWPLYLFCTLGVIMLIGSMFQFMSAGRINKR